MHTCYNSPVALLNNVSAGGADIILYCTVVKTKVKPSVFHYE